MVRFFLEKHGKRLGSIALGALLFMTGWQLGRVMSPYYASHPIIFEDRQCSACLFDSGGSAEAIGELREDGIGQREGSAATTSLAAPEGMEYVGSVNSNLYHHVSCGSARTIREENRVWFASAQEAAGVGRSPSQCTQNLGAE